MFETLHRIHILVKVLRPAATVMGFFNDSALGFEPVLFIPLSPMNAANKLPHKLYLLHLFHINSFLFLSQLHKLFLRLTTVHFKFNLLR